MKRNLKVQPNTDIEAEYKEFEFFQKIVVDIYAELSRVLNDNNINHYVAYGSLLGLIRDNGMIPWDYDIDIMVSYSDLDRMLKALNGLNKDYYYVYSNNIPNYPLPVLRVCRKGYTYMSIHVDVFMLIGLPSDSVLQEKQIKAINRLCSIRLNKYIGFHETKLTGIKYRLLRVYNYAKRFPYILYPQKLLEKQESKIFGKYRLEKSQMCMNLSCVHFARTNCFLNPIIKEVEGVKYSIPEQYEKVLREEFGDYSKYQPFSVRYSEYKKLLKLIKINQKYYKDVLEKKSIIYN